WEYLRPHLERRIGPVAARPKDKLKGIVPEGLDEMVRTAACLEQLAPHEKVELGEWICTRLTDPAVQGGPWAWALRRPGARKPVTGAAHRTVDPEKAAEWIELFLRLSLKAVDGAPFAVAQLARRTGDRTRDIDEALRARVVDALRAVNVPPSFVQLVTEVV